MTKRTKARTKRAVPTTRKQAEKPVDAEIRHAAERAGILGPTVESQERLNAALSRLLSGGLWIDEDDELCAERALIHVTGALVKAIAVSISTPDGDYGPDGWVLADDKMTSADLVAALSAVASLLQGSRTVLQSMRAHGRFRGSAERIDRMSEERRQEVVEGGAS
jgi:hypothetical protein